MIDSINTFDRRSIKKAYGDMYKSKMTQLNESCTDANGCGGMMESEYSPISPIEEEVMVWDNGGKTQDRYTVAFLNYGGETWSMDEHPSEPQGIGKYDGDFTIEYLDNHENIGEKIPFSKLPEACQKFVNGLLEQFKNEDDEPVDDDVQEESTSVDESDTTNLLSKSEELRKKSKILAAQISRIEAIGRNGMEKLSNSVELLDYLSAAADLVKTTADSMVAEISKYR